MVEMSNEPPSQPTAFDTSDTPLDERSWRAILQHVQEVGDEAETSYLEIKSTLDITSGQRKVHIGKQAITKISKFLLGMANRQPKDTLRHFQGYAVLVIGAEKNNIKGVPRGIEQHDLENALSPYLGPQFPGFELGRISISEAREVLFIIAIPPEEGQSIYPCHRDYQSDKNSNSLRNGAIYVRNSSSTREARSGEVLALVKRARGRRKPPIDLDVGLDGPIHRVSRINEAVSSLYEYEEEDFGEEIAEQYRRENAPASLFQINLSSFMTPPTSSDMKKALQAWKRRLPEHIAASRRYLLGASLNFSRIRVISRGRFISKPCLSIIFHDCEILEWLDSDNANWERMVEPVMRKANMFGYGSNIDELSVNIPDPQLSFENDTDGALMTLGAESFRPDTPWYSKTATCVILTQDDSTERVEVTWSLTEDDNDEVTTGNFSIATEPLVTAESLVAQLLRKEK